MKIRIKDIAEMAGVSTGTVDRVLHNRGEVSGSTRERVMEIIKKLNYEPDILARTLASKHPLRVGVLIPFHTPENKFWLEPLTGIREAEQELQYFGVELTEYLYDMLDVRDFLLQSSQVLADRPDAVITAPVFQKESHAFAASCHRQGIRLILINDDLRSDYQLSYIGQDARKSGMVAAHLMSLSVKNAADYLLLSVARERDNDQHIQQREEGFLAFWNGFATKRRGRILSHSIPNGSYIYVKRSLADLFRKHPGISGIFVTSSRVYQVARYLQNTGRDEILLIGYDLISPNIKYLNLGVIDFLISQKPREQGYRSMITAFNVIRLNKQTRPSQIIPIDIITRENFCCYET